MVLHARCNTANEIEIPVLRHQLAVLHRREPRPRISWTDRAVIAALTRLLPPRRRHGFLITPATILRWHRHLVRRRWTIPPVRAGRPAIPTGIRALTRLVLVEEFAQDRSTPDPAMGRLGHRRCRAWPAPRRMLWSA
jgi:hypothetical protein